MDDLDFNFFEEVRELLRRDRRVLTVYLVSGMRYLIEPLDIVSIINDVVLIRRDDDSRSMFPLFQICSIDHID